MAKNDCSLLIVTLFVGEHHVIPYVWTSACCYIDTCISYSMHACVRIHYLVLLIKVPRNYNLFAELK